MNREESPRFAHAAQWLQKTGGRSGRRRREHCSDSDDRGWSALIVSGGASRRMGTDKAELVLDPEMGHTQLHRTVTACLDAGADLVVVVGPTPQRITWADSVRQGSLHEQRVVFTLERDRFAGPVAALAAGAPLIDEPWTMLLPVDLADPAKAVQQLQAALNNAETLTTSTGWVGVDDEGHRQHLTTLVDTSVLQAALSEKPQPRSVRELATRWELAELSGTWDDLDTIEDLVRLRAGHESNGVDD